MEGPAHRGRGGAEGLQLAVAAPEGGLVAAAVGDVGGQAEELPGAARRVAGEDDLAAPEPPVAAVGVPGPVLVLDGPAGSGGVELPTAVGQGGQVLGVDQLGGDDGLGQRRRPGGRAQDRGRDGVDERVAGGPGVEAVQQVGRGLGDPPEELSAAGQLALDLPGAGQVAVSLDGAEDVAVKGLGGDDDDHGDAPGRG